jgi:DMSO/TMAO reductase YedYZ heme-binding membrane subunit
MGATMGEMSYEGIFLTVAGIVAGIILLFLAWAGCKVVRHKLGEEEF